MILSDTLPNFEGRNVGSGLETRSIIQYQGYQIMIRAWQDKFGEGSISAYIYKEHNGKNIRLRQRHYTIFEPEKLIEQFKEYINNYEINLVKKLLKSV